MKKKMFEAKKEAFRRSRMFNREIYSGRRYVTRITVMETGCIKVYCRDVSLNENSIDVYTWESRINPVSGCLEVKVQYVTQISYFDKKFLGL